MGLLSRLFSVGRGITKKVARDIAGQNDVDHEIEAELEGERSVRPTRVKSAPVERSAEQAPVVPNASAPAESEEPPVSESVQVTQRDGSKRSL